MFYITKGLVVSWKIAGIS